MPAALTLKSDNMNPPPRVTAGATLVRMFKVRHVAVLVQVRDTLHGRQFRRAQQFEIVGNLFDDTAVYLLHHDVVWTVALVAVNDALAEWRQVARRATDLPVCRYNPSSFSNFARLRTPVAISCHNLTVVRTSLWDF